MGDVVAVDVTCALRASVTSVAFGLLESLNWLRIRLASEPLCAHAPHFRSLMLGTLVSTLGLRVGRPLTMSAAPSPAGGPLCPPLPSEVPTAARGLATFAMG